MNKNIIEESKIYYLQLQTEFIIKETIEGNLKLDFDKYMKNNSLQELIDDIRKYILDYSKRNNLCEIAKQTIINSMNYNGPKNRKEFFNNIKTDYNKIDNNFDKSIVQLTAYNIFNKFEKLNGLINIKDIDPLGIFELAIIENRIIETSIEIIFKDIRKKEINSKNNNNNNNNNIEKEIIGDPEELLNNIKLSLLKAKKNEEIQNIKDFKKYLDDLFEKADLYNYIEEATKDPNYNDYNEFEIYENQILESITLFIILLQYNTDTKIPDYKRFIDMILYKSPALVYGLF